MGLGQWAEFEVDGNVTTVRLWQATGGTDEPAAVYRLRTGAMWEEVSSDAVLTEANDPSFFFFVIKGAFGIPIIAFACAGVSICYCAGLCTWIEKRVRK